MNRQEAIEVLEMIQDFYPRYNVSKQKARILIQALLPMDYERVKEKLEAYVAAHPYAPTIAEIAAYSVVTNKQLDQLGVWRREAAHVPLRMKQEFEQKIALLLEGNINDRDSK